MAKDIATEDLAGMVQRGFRDTNERIERGFVKNEEHLTELSQVLQAILKQVSDTNSTLKSLELQDLRERVKKLEQRAGAS